MLSAKISEVNLSAFIYDCFMKDLSSIILTNTLELLNFLCLEHV